jgi:hypothetical protein
MPSSAPGAREVPSPATGPGLAASRPRQLRLPITARKRYHAHGLADCPALDLGGRSGAHRQPLSLRFGPSAPDASSHLRDQSRDRLARPHERSGSSFEREPKGEGRSLIAAGTRRFELSAVALDEFPWRSPTPSPGRQIAGRCPSSSNAYTRQRPKPVSRFISAAARTASSSTDVAF